MLSPAGREGLETWHHPEALAHVDGRDGRRGRASGGRDGPWPGGRRSCLHALEEPAHLGVTGMEHEHDVVAAERSDGREPRALTVPGELVMQHHGVSHQRLELGHRVPVSDEVVVAVERIIRLVGEDFVDERPGIGDGLGHRRYHGLGVDLASPAVPEDVEQEAEDCVLGGLVPARRQRAVGQLDDRRGRAGVEGLGDGQEDVAALVRNVTPARRPLVVQDHRVSIRPEEIRGHVAEQPVAVLIGARIAAGNDIDLGARLLLEVPPDHRLELLHRLEEGDVEGREEVEGKHDAAVSVDDETLHTTLFPRGGGGSCSMPQKNDGRGPSRASQSLKTSSVSM